MSDYDGADPADPKPLRVDPRFAAAAARCAPADASADELKSMTYELFRKDYFAWSHRRRQRKMKAAAAAANPGRHPRPRGPKRLWQGDARCAGARGSEEGGGIGELPRVSGEPSLREAPREAQREALRCRRPLA